MDPSQPTAPAARRGSHPAPFPAPPSALLPAFDNGMSHFAAQQELAAGLRAAQQQRRATVDLGGPEQFLQPPQQQQPQPQLTWSSARSLEARLQQQAANANAGCTVVTNAPSATSAVPAPVTAAPSASTIMGASSGAASLGSLPSLPRVVVTSSPKQHPEPAKSMSGKQQPNGKPKASNKPAKKSHKRSRHHAMPTSIVLPHSSARLPPPTHPVPEFLCHLYSMLSESAYADLLTWVVPTENEPADRGGGKAGVGKVVVRDPTRLQDEVLGRYYRHSKYSSFQRQLNYFGFKKRVHGQRKGKMCPCSFVHDSLGPDPQSLLRLNRRPPSHKNKASDASTLASDWSGFTGAQSKASAKAGKKRRPTKDGETKAALSPSAVSMSSVSTSHSPHRPQQQAQNEPWANPSALPAMHPLTLSSAAQSALFPGMAASNAWPPPANNGIPAPTSAPVAPNPAPSNPAARDDISAIRASNNAAVLAARKSLAENFLKSKRERPTEVASSALGPPSASMPGGGVVQQQALPGGNVVQQQWISGQQSIQQQLMLGNALQQQSIMLGNAAPQQSMAPNQFANVGAPAFFKVDNNGFPSDYLINTHLAAVSTKTNDGPAQPTAQAASTLEGKDWKGSAANSVLAVPTPTFPSDPTTAANALLGQIGLFSSKAFDASAVGPTVAGINALLPAMAHRHSLQHTDSMGSDYVRLMLGTAESHPTGMDESPPHQYGDLFSNLMSTALPPSEDMFDDDLSAGAMSEDFGLALQVADDGGMMMPPTS